MDTFNPFSLDNKLIVITGASSGIGAQCAIDCSKMGAKVMLIARNEERLKKTLQQCDTPDRHAYFCADLSNLTEISPIVEQIVREHGKIDGFIHAAGMEKTLPLQLLDTASYEEVYRTNSLSAFEFIRLFSKKKNFNNGGHIVLIASISGVIGRGCVAAYSASKGAMISAVRSMAVEFAQREICINCVSPGTILTPMMEEYLATLTPEEREKRTSGFLLGLGQVTDISNACIYLASNASRWVTGQNIVVDGGYSAQ